MECFAAPFQCAPCNAFAPVYGKAAAESAVNAPSGILKCVEITRAADEETATQQGISGFPCTRILREGQPVGSDVRGNDEQACVKPSRGSSPSSAK